MRALRMFVAMTVVFAGFLVVVGTADAQIQCRNGVCYQQPYVGTTHYGAGRVIAVNGVPVVEGTVGHRVSYPCPPCYTPQPTCCLPVAKKCCPSPKCTEWEETGETDAEVRYVLTKVQREVTEFIEDPHCKVCREVTKTEEKWIWVKHCPEDK